MKNKIGALVIEVFSVMLGVFLGFAISDWSESQKEKAKFEALMTNMTSEIRANQQKIEQMIDYHRMLRDSTRYLLNQNEKKITKPTFFRGVNTLTFSDSGYQTGIQTGLFNKLNLENIQAINEVYTKQRNYEDFSTVLLSGLISLDFKEDAESIRKIARFLSISMTDIVIKEEQLLRSMETALEGLRQSNPTQYSKPGETYN
jgi:hypothetical protein